MRLTLEAAVHPPFCASFHTKPPIEAFKHFEDARNTEMTGGICIVWVHDLRSGKKRYIDADGNIEEGSAQTASGSIRCRDDGNRFADKQESIVVSLDQATFCSKIDYGCAFAPCRGGNVIAKSEG